MPNPNQEPKMTGLSYDQLQELLLKVVEVAGKPNALEQKQIDEEMEKDRRRRVLAVELGRVEEEARWRRQNSCSHSRDEKTGEGVARGKGVYTTQGQLHGDDTVSLICMRCATRWHFKADPSLRDYILNGPGLLGFAPPPIEKCLNQDEFAPRPQPREVAQ